MEAASAGAARAGGRVVGITAPDVFPERSSPNAHLTEEVTAPTIPTRLAMLLDGTDAAIVLPGSIGTLAELVVSWNVRFVARHGFSPDLVLVAVGPDWGDLMPILANRLAVPIELVELVDTAGEAVALVMDRLGLSSPGNPPADYPPAAHMKPRHSDHRGRRRGGLAASRQRCRDSPGAPARPRRLDPPQGKAPSPEEPHETALREVWEETGLHCRITSPAGMIHYVTGGEDKLVRYWAMRQIEGTSSPTSKWTRFRGSPAGRQWTSSPTATTPSWWPPSTRTAGSTPRGSILSGTPMPGFEQVGGRRPDPSPIAKGVAPDRSHHRIAPLRRIERIISSPYLRCAQTVDPLAEELGLKVEEHMRLPRVPTSTSPRPFSMRSPGPGRVLLAR